VVSAASPPAWRERAVRPVWAATTWPTTNDERTAAHSRRTPWKTMHGSSS